MSAARYVRRYSTGRTPELFRAIINRGCFACRFSPATHARRMNILFFFCYFESKSIVRPMRTRIHIFQFTILHIYEYNFCLTHHANFPTLITIPYGNRDGFSKRVANYYSVCDADGRPIITFRFSPRKTIIIRQKRTCLRAWNQFVLEQEYSTRSRGLRETRGRSP